MTDRLKPLKDWIEFVIKTKRHGFGWTGYEIRGVDRFKVRIQFTSDNYWKTSIMQFDSVSCKLEDDYGDDWIRCFDYDEKE